MEAWFDIDDVVDLRFIVDHIERERDRFSDGFVTVYHLALLPDTDNIMVRKEGQEDIFTSHICITEDSFRKNKEYIDEEEKRRRTHEETGT